MTRFVSSPSRISAKAAIAVFSIIYSCGDFVDAFLFAIPSTVMERCPSQYTFGASRFSSPKEDDVVVRMNFASTVEDLCFEPDEQLKFSERGDSLPLEMQKKELAEKLFELSEPTTKRVPVVIRYTADSGLKPYYLTLAKKIKDTYPDVTLDKCILPSVGGDNDDDVTFEVMIDGKAVVGRSRKERFGGRGDMSIFVSMDELDNAISRARRKRRPATVYGEDLSNVRLELLRQRNAIKSAEHWK